MGVERSSFGALALAATMCIVAQSYWGIPVVGVLYFAARWLSKKDDQFIGILIVYLNESHVYDATPRLSDHNSRPKGWGKGLPL
jgi:hypothetical protein